MGLQTYYIPTPHKIFLWSRGIPQYPKMARFSPFLVILWYCKHTISYPPTRFSRDLVGFQLITKAKLWLGYKQYIGRWPQNIDGMEAYKWNVTQGRGTFISPTGKRTLSISLQKQFILKNSLYPLPLPALHGFLLVPGNVHLPPPVHEPQVAPQQYHHTAKCRSFPQPRI